ncbi:hypothetical protein Tco_1040664 [Tanacetum coccineum]
MQIPAFMSNSKCPELARRFADQVPQTVTEMMRRVDDFVKSEEAFKSTKLPKGEQSEKGHGTPYRGFRPTRTAQNEGPPKGDVYNNYNRRDHYQPYVPPRQPVRSSHPHPTLRLVRHRKRGNMEGTRLSRGKGALHQRLLSAKKAVGNCSRIWKTQSSRQGCEAEGRKPGKAARQQQH